MYHVVWPYCIILKCDFVVWSSMCHVLGHCCFIMWHYYTGSHSVCRWRPPITIFLCALMSSTSRPRRSPSAPEARASTSTPGTVSARMSTASSAGSSLVSTCYPGYVMSNSLVCLVWVTVCSTKFYCKYQKHQWWRIRRRNEPYMSGLFDASPLQAIS